MIPPRSVKAVEWNISAELTQAEPQPPPGWRHVKPPVDLEPLFDPVEVLKNEAFRSEAVTACCAAAAKPDSEVDAGLLQEVRR